MTINNCEKLVTLFGILYFALAGSSRACDVEVRLESGRVCGVRRWAEDNAVYASFRGVPYAQQPLGELRFKELQPLDPWDGVFNATVEGPVCPQKDQLFGNLMKPQGMSEACIHANIHVPEDALPDAKPEGTTGLPILVFMHGGGFESGSGDADFYGPEYLVTKGNIVITFNYRLNVFGFLSLNSSSIPGNQGLRDAVTLLRWVQRNARAFGGDPDDVTLMGQSAGSTAAHILSLSPAAVGLFKRVFLMSSTAIQSYYTASPKFAKDVADQLITALEINSTDPEDVHRQLVAMPLNTIMEKYYPLQDQGFTVFTPVVDTSFPGVTMILDDEPEILIQRGRGQNIPLIIGFTTAEMHSLKRRVEDLKLVDQVKQNPALLVSPKLVYSLPQDTVLNIGKRIEKRYFNGNVTLDKYLDCISDIFMVYPAMKLAQWRAKQGGAPVFLYQFSYEAKHNLVKEGLGVEYKGVGHMEDLTYVFRVNSALGEHRSFPPAADDIDDRMKDWMTRFVTSFMKCSHPSCDDRMLEYEVWPPVAPETLKYQDIGRPNSYRVVEPTQQQTEMIQFFDSIYEPAM